MKYITAKILVICLFSINSYAQYINPLKIPLSLSGNFGELRNNHFHAGLDFKTQSVTDKPVYSIADGYVSRISVSPTGYGLAIYVTHPRTSTMSVYAHLNGFAPKIASYVEDQQYAKETYAIDLTLDKKQFVVKQDDLLAYSGNTGASGGPHVHFEMRDLKTEEVIDPLMYYKTSIKDIVAPEVRGVAVYPIEGDGVVNNSRNPLRQNIVKNKKGVIQPLKTPIEAWGIIGLGVKAYDRMTGTSNIYGVKTIRLYMDDKEIFRSQINSFSYAQIRMLNTFIDFEDWRNNKSFFMRSFIEPGNALPFYKAKNDGYVTIDKEKPYSFRYELEDIYGNTTVYKFSIVGKKQAIPQKNKCDSFMSWNKDNKYTNDGFSLVIPKGNLYNDFCFTLATRNVNGYLSKCYKVNKKPVPLHQSAEMKIKLVKDTLKNKKQYGIVALKGKVDAWIGGVYEKGYLSASIRELGAEYAISTDTENPKIIPYKPENWMSNQKIYFRITDNKSGVSSVRGTINGKFVLFKNDVKSSLYIYEIDKKRLGDKDKYNLKVIATDACGNSNEYAETIELF